MKNRRNFLKGTLALPLIGLVAACRRPEQDYSVCSDESLLNENERQIRKTLAYVNKTDDPLKNCSTCKLYLAPSGGAFCGGCTVMKGPVSPLGTCKTWIVAGS